MKIVGFSVVGPNEGNRYLKRTLDEFKRLCDDVVIACNNTDKQTEEMIEQYGFKFYRDDREWGKYQPLIKTALLERIAELNPTHILPLDSDEVFVGVERKDLEAMADNLGTYFYIVNLWNKEDRYIPELSFWNIRFYKFNPNLTQFIAKNLHCGLAPLYAYQVGKYAPFMVKHFGLMNPKDRERKVDRYKKYDPNAVFKAKSYYDALSAKSEGTPLDLVKLKKEVEADVQKMGKQKKRLTDNTTMKYVYMIKDARTIDVPEGSEKHYLAKGWRVMSQILSVPGKPFGAAFVSESEAPKKTEKPAAKKKKNEDTV